MNTEQSIMLQKQNKEKKNVNQVVILCGGRGTRLKPVTDEIPKALVKLNGRPIIDYILDFYRSKGYERFILCLGYKGDKIKEHFSREFTDSHVEYSDAGESASMLERIWAVRNLIEEHFIVSYGDTLIDLDIDEMLSFHKKSQSEATIVTTKIRNPFGLLEFDSQGVVTSFVEKPLLNYYIGSFIMERSTLDCVTTDMLNHSDGQGLIELFDLLMKKQKLKAYEHKGNQITFNTETERQLAEESLGQFYTFREEGS